MTTGSVNPSSRTGVGSYCEPESNGAILRSRDLAYWLQGLFELSDPKVLNEKQVSLIKKHLHLVFAHEIDPSFGEDQEPLQEIHDAPEPEVARSKATISFEGDKTTLEGLFGKELLTLTEALEVFTTYFKVKATAEAAKNTEGPVKVPRRPGNTGGGFNPGSSGGGPRIMC